MRWLAMTFLAVLAGAAPAAHAQTAPGMKWSPYIDFEAKPGNKRDIGEANVFVPLAQTDRTLFFGDLRGRFDGNSNREGNFGLGVRHMLANGWNIGGYGYFDRRRTETGNFFNQTTLGAEALGPDWDLRANFYLPNGSRTRDLGTTGGGAPTAAISGNTVQITTPGLITREERALKGYDAEVGWRAPLFDAQDKRQLRLFLGGYHFSDAGIRVSGPRLRAEFVTAEVPGLWKGARLALGAELQHDHARGRQAFVSLRLRIPFGGGSGERAGALNAQERRMTEPVMRDVDIVTQSRVSGSTAPLVETASLTGAGQSFSLISSANTTGAALPGAVAAAGPNSLVVLSGTFNTSAITTLQTGQTLMGAGSVTVRAPSGATATLVTPGATITGAVAGNNPAVFMGDNSTLTGMTVSNLSTGGGTPNPFAVRATGVTGAVVSNNTLTGLENLVGGTAQGLLISSSSNITVSGNTMTGTGTGIAVGLNVVNSTGILVTGNTMSATGSSAGNSRAIVINNGSFAAGSTGNTILTGICSVAAAGTGSIGLTGGGTCP
ncbi:MULTISPECIES: inverse autotransporter beta domain-containing protein [unclassified Polaromonas]|uniref:inverse autotransporter beta domain-containing protein n=1 Tax=unclassified Polaromonas TaxID=2638319 RepID=UPI000F0759B9|nr:MULTISPECIES: inverse autotransporter beta domain-containing protein [unclassified Polaromonas]AYQ28469.1 right-handed parallel beta-helix repeat-containing protein [Polaromonas sp. SP1]QGJ20411.1 right-handed parallel beta-helix repeat-containing protein [Polaromonas sp. Pch-P]